MKKIFKIFTILLVVMLCCGCSKEEKKIENIHDANEKKVEHEFWIEEIMKTEEFLQEAGSF